VTAAALLVADRGVRATATSTIDRGSRMHTDLSGLLAGSLPEPPRPVSLTRSDGHAIFYSGQVNNLFGEPESGKTMVALAAIEEASKAGSRTVFLDIDHNGVEGIVTRLVALGVPVEYLADAERFRYVEPEDGKSLLDLVAFLVTWRPVIVVVDSVGELLPMFRLSSNNPDDFTTVHAQVLKPLASAGAAVVTVDHVAKNAASAESGPTGTAAKRRAVGGVSIRVKVKDQFVPGAGGSAWLMVNKDRHGGLRQFCPRGEREPVAGLFTLIPDGDRLAWDLRPGENSDAGLVGGVNPLDLIALDQLDPNPASVRDVADRLKWQTKRAGDVLREWRRLHPVAESPATPEQPATSSVAVTGPPVSETSNRHATGSRT
jgi:hypothetical protein